MKIFFYKLINKFIVKKLSLCRIRKEKEKTVYLTFDDGPESGITEFVLSELDKYGFKATFFCCGSNAEKHPELLEAIYRNGHLVANHTFSHIHSYRTKDKRYIADVEHAAEQLQTVVFRPPWGALKLSAFLELRRKFRIVMWNLDSGDAGEHCIAEHSIQELCQGTRRGAIVLFHFSKQHESNTRKILPSYLKWLSENAWTSSSL